MSDELVSWLEQQLDVDERIVQAIEDEEQHWDPGDKNLGSAVIGAEYGAAVVVGPYDHLDWSVRQYIAEHDPARVLREIDAKRRILAEHALNGWVCDTCDNGEVDQTFPCPTLRLLALPYADRPGYREEWRP
ncbi:DUF6221 family protein [Streptomyces sp. NBC_00645]|uniref:DUF6221 family protein n=1 Tax=Streptomyces sp. NBC_00645 TaxID=2975795 RepID=UPI0032528EBC